MSREANKQSLQQKVSLTLVGVMTVLAVLIYATLNRVVAPAFDQLELDEARTNLVRAERAIHNELRNLSAITGDWGMWDDAFNYVRGQDPAFRDSNLHRATLTNLDLNLLAIYDLERNLLWDHVDYGGTGHEADSLQLLEPGSDSASFLLNHRNRSGGIDGLVRTALGPMMISSWPIVHSDGSGPVSGTMIMGKFLDESRAAVLREQTEVRLSWEPVDPFYLGGDAQTVPLNGPGDAAMRHDATVNEIFSSGWLVDLFGSPLLRLRVMTPRNISFLGNSTVNAAMAFLGVAAVTLCLVTWLLLRRIIVVPLQVLSNHITAIRDSGDLNRKLCDSRRDEIGALANEFDKLTSALHDARTLLLDQSFKAGKADNAAEVMHNVRNAMTPLINCIDRLSRNLDEAGKLKVAQAVKELTDPDCPDGRKDKLIRYIDSAFSHIGATNSEAMRNLDIAAKQAHQVEAILRDQEKHAHVEPVVERLQLDDVIDEAVLVVRGADDADVEFSLEDGIDKFSVTAHRVGLLQILGNLILNAYESIQRNGSEQRRIALAACEVMSADSRMIRLTISDTGCGFDAATGEKIFQRGYSSKEGNMSGLGLHWCANALSGMGGRIHAESDGPGRGAKFHVLLPAAQGGMM